MKLRGINELISQVLQGIYQLFIELSAKFLNDIRSTQRTKTNQSYWPKFIFFGCNTKMTNNVFCRLY